MIDLVPAMGNRVMLDDASDGGYIIRSGPDVRLGDIANLVNDATCHCVQHLAGTCTETDADVCESPSPDEDTEPPFG